jgi:hypothetical protein
MKKEKLPSDFSKKARRVVELATGENLTQNSQKPTKEEHHKNPAAVALGRLGGLKGGKARANKLSPEKRKEIAKKAAEVRWKKK